MVDNFVKLYKSLVFNIRNNPQNCDNFSKKKVEMSGLTAFQVKSA